jgi:glycosyltransferase involved in cell wall biosynthesis
LQTLKAGLVSARLSRNGGGVSQVVADLSRKIAAQGVTVKVFGLEDAAWNVDDESAWTGAPASTVRALGPNSLGYSPAMARQLMDWEPDVLHLHGIWTHPSRSVLQWARRSRRPYIISVHGMLGSVALSFSPRKKALSRWLFQDAAFLAASAFHATCMKEAEEIRAFGLRQPIAIIPNGTDIPAGRSHRTPSEPFVLSLGRIHPKKGLDRLILAWAQISAEFPAWRLRVTGTSEMNHACELKKLTQEHDLDTVDITGPVFGSEKTALLASAELFALPTRHENFALTVAESLAVSRPVISTKGAPWAGLESNGCGWWIDHGVEAMAAALRSAMSLPSEERQAMGERGRAWMARDFGWESIAAQMIDVYRWLISGEKQPACICERLPRG